MSSYTITSVSAKEPRMWGGDDNKAMSTYRVMLAGESEPVEVNRKSGDKPTPGEVLNGTLTSTQYGIRFKAEPKKFGSTGSFSPRDTSEIKAQWAISQAITILKSGIETEAPSLPDIEPLAQDLFCMIDRVKIGEPSGKAKAAAVIESMKAKRGTEKPDAVYQTGQAFVTTPDAGDIDPNEIPF